MRSIRHQDLVYEVTYSGTGVSFNVVAICYYVGWGGLRIQAYGMYSIVSCAVRVSG